MSKLETSISMSPFQKWIVILLSLFLLATVAGLIIWTTDCNSGKHSCKNSNYCNIVNGSNPIPIDTITPKLVPIAVALAEEKRFDFVCDSIRIKRYNGAILRNADILLSLGLNSNDLLKYTHCEKLRVRTRLALTSDNKIRIFVHPVEINTINNHTIITDLQFNSKGQICDSIGKLWVNPCRTCKPCLDESTTRNAENDQISTSAGKSDTYVMDLTNPCPPCKLSLQ